MAGNGTFGASAFSRPRVLGKPNAQQEQRPVAPAILGQRKPFSFGGESPQPVGASKNRTRPLERQSAVEGTGIGRGTDGLALQRQARQNLLGGGQQGQGVSAGMPQFGVNPLKSGQPPPLQANLGWRGQGVAPLAAPGGITGPTDGGSPHAKDIGRLGQFGLPTAPTVTGPTDGGDYTGSGTNTLDIANEQLGIGRNLLGQGGKLIDFGQNTTENARPDVEESTESAALGKMTAAELEALRRQGEFSGMGDERTYQEDLVRQMGENKANQGAVAAREAGAAQGRAGAGSLGMEAAYLRSIGKNWEAEQLLGISNKDLEMERGDVRQLGEMANAAGTREGNFQIAQEGAILGEKNLGLGQSELGASLSETGAKTVAEGAETAEGQAGREGKAYETNQEYADRVADRDWKANEADLDRAHEIVIQEGDIEGQLKLEELKEKWGTSEREAAEEFAAWMDNRTNTETATQAAKSKAREKNLLVYDLAESKHGEARKRLEQIWRAAEKKRISNTKSGTWEPGESPTEMQKKADQALADWRAEEKRWKDYVENFNGDEGYEDFLPEDSGGGEDEPRPSWLD